MYTLAVLHSFKNMRMPASTGQSGVKVVQTPVNSNLLLVYLLLTSSIADPSAILSKLSTSADLLATVFSQDVLGPIPRRIP